MHVALRILCKQSNFLVPAFSFPGKVCGIKPILCQLDEKIQSGFPLFWKFPYNLPSRDLLPRGTLPLYMEIRRNVASCWLLVPTDSLPWVLTACLRKGLAIWCFQ